MDNITAVNMINNMHFMPGWSFRAEDPGGDTVMAAALIETVNSNHDQAVMGYPQHVTLERMILIHPVDYATEDDLAAALISWLLDIMIHESREFLRVGDDLRAPFHPHRPEGESKWNRLVTQPDLDPMRGAIVLNV